MTETSMNEPNHGQQVQRKKRPWLMVLIIMLALPFGVLTLLWWSYESKAHAQHTLARAAEAQFAQTQTNEFSIAGQPTATIEAPSGFSSEPQVSWQSQRTTAPRHRTVTETTMREESFDVFVPYTDPNTGTVSPKIETRTRMVPVQSTRAVPVTEVNSLQNIYNHEPGVLRLVQELKSMQGAGADKQQFEAKSNDLRSRLDTEFSEMHQRQASEIEAAEKRLTTLKKLHDERGNNRSQIVQRRIDQLIGKSNPLDWDTRSSTSFSPVEVDAQSQLSLPAPPSELNGANLFTRRIPSGVSQQREQLPTTDLQLPRTQIAEAVASRNVDNGNSPVKSSLDRLNEVFVLIANASEARQAERAAKQQEPSLEYESAKQKSKLLSMQLEAIGRALTFEQKSAKDRLEQAHNALDRTDASDTEKAAATRELAKEREIAYEAATEMLAQFEKAMKLVTEEKASEQSPPISGSLVSPIESSSGSANAENEPAEDD